MTTTNQTRTDRWLTGGLLLLASIIIFAIAQVIERFLYSYELTSMYISFCAGFILFTPLVSLALHPLISINRGDSHQFKATDLIVNVGLVAVVQGAFFLIWMTDAIAIYSIYVDANSFLAKAFNITSEKTASLNQEFYWFNLFLAWFFSLLSLTLGLLPCLIARLKNLGVVGNFVSAFLFAKQCKLQMLYYALGLAFSVVMPLMYMKYLFILLFPIILTWIFIDLTKHYLAFDELKSNTNLR